MGWSWSRVNHGCFISRQVEDHNGPQSAICGPPVTTLAPTSPYQTIDSRPRTLTIPITTVNSAVQSNEIYPPPSPLAAGFGVRGATDRRCSLGRPFLIEPINRRIRPCDSYLPSRCCSAQYHRSHLLIAIQSTRLKVNLFIGQRLSRLIFLCRSQRGSRFAFRIINLFSSRTNWSAPALALLQMQETQTDVEHWVQPISAASMTLILTARGAASQELQAPTFLSRAINALPPSGVNETTACRCT